MTMRDQIAQIIEDTYDVSKKREIVNIDEIADAILAALTLHSPTPTP